ncbi:unnamed protein product, partial [marine sediment metagenome]
SSPGPVTWVFPAADEVPPWIKGDYKTVAIRVTDHPIARQICESFGKPIVSTSANLHGQSPLNNYADVIKAFEGKVDYIV